MLLMRGQLVDHESRPAGPAKAAPHAPTMWPVQCTLAHGRQVDKNLAAELSGAYNVGGTPDVSIRHARPMAKV